MRSAHQTLACILGCGLACLAAWSLRAAEKDPKVELLNTFNSEFISITPGVVKFPESFQMGSDDGPSNERPSHKVRLSEPFSMAKYEVPQNLYEAVMEVNPSKWKGPRNSAEMMTFADAQQFCRQATELMRSAKLIKDDEEIRLPTEAEWEYCCRAGTTTKYSFGDKATDDGDRDAKASILNKYAWHTGNAAGNDPPVGAKEPNAWGLYDVHGYLWEFVADDWHDTYEGAPTNGSNWSIGKPGSPHVVRGGSWKDKYPLLTSTARRKIEPDATGDEIGFRCVKAKVRK